MERGGAAGAASSLVRELKGVDRAHIPHRGGGARLWVDRRGCGVEDKGKGEVGGGGVVLEEGENERKSTMMQLMVV